MIRDPDHPWLAEALAEARRAYNEGEIPIGAVIVFDGCIVGRGHNRRENLPDATAHAEILAIREACRTLGRWRLNGATLYVTIEPCPMCAGAIVNARIDRLVYGAGDSKAGAVDSLFQLTDQPALNHRVEVRAGLMEMECRNLMKQFFREQRRQRSDA